MLDTADARTAIGPARNVARPARMLAENAPAIRTGSIGRGRSRTVAACTIGMVSISCAPNSLAVGFERFDKASDRFCRGRGTNALFCKLVDHDVCVFAHRFRPLFAAVCPDANVIDAFGVGLTARWSIASPNTAVRHEITLSPNTAKPGDLTICSNRNRSQIVTDSRNPHIHW